MITLPSTAQWIFVLCIVVLATKPECTFGSPLDFIYEKFVSWNEPDLFLLREKTVQLKETTPDLKIKKHVDSIDYAVPVPINSTIILQNVNPFAYDLYQIDIPKMDLHGDPLYLAVYVTLYVGDVTLYVGVTPQSYYHNSGAFHVSELGCIGFFKVKEGISSVYISVQGSTAAFRNQYEFKEGPSISSYSIGAVISQEKYQIRTSLPLTNGLTTVTFPKDVSPTYFVYHVESDETLYLDVLWVSSRITIAVSTKTEFPTSSHCELAYHVDAGSSFAKRIPSKKGDTVYISVYSSTKSTSEAALLMKQGDVDVDIIETTVLGVSHIEKQFNSYYRFNILDTGAYKWIRIKFKVIGDVTVLVRHGARPSNHEWDWKYISHASSTKEKKEVWDYMYISSSDPKFESGQYYFTFHYSGEVPDNDYFSVELESWLPRMI